MHSAGMMVPNEARPVFFFSRQTTSNRGQICLSLSLSPQNRPSLSLSLSLSPPIARQDHADVLGRPVLPLRHISGHDVYKMDCVLSPGIAKETFA
jgi:hypothetical protein